MLISLAASASLMNTGAASAPAQNQQQQYPAGTGPHAIMMPGVKSIVAVASGKGGVGKTNVSANLGIALSNLGKKVLIMDADLGLGNIDVLLGLHPKYTLESVIQGEHTLDEVMVNGPNGVKVIPAASGILLHTEYGLFRFRILANMVKSVQKGREVYDKLLKVTDRFLDVALEFSGAVPYDESVLKAIRKQRAVVEAFPRSQASVSYKQIAEKTIRWPIPKTANGHLEFFVERLIQGNTLNAGINS